MDPILYWNDVALEANRVSHTNGKNEQTGPTLSSRALAIVHLAMHDAWFAIEGGHNTYLPNLPAPAPGASAAAAVAAAAHATLDALFPSQQAYFDRKHLEAGLSGPGLAEGYNFGHLVAQCILEDRKCDPDASDKGYAPSIARYAHRPDPDNPNQGYHAPFYGARSKGFAISDRHELAGPPVNHPNYPYSDFVREVLEKGIAPELMGTLPDEIVDPPASPPIKIEPRTARETLIGLYWAYDGSAGLGTPPRMYNQIIRKVAEMQANTVAQNARLFALVNVAMADAGILAWDQKYIHNFWRPVVGIREHDESMGPAGVVPPPGQNDFNPLCDPGWLPLGAPSTNATATPTMTDYPCGHVLHAMAKNVTPPFPAYPSGHATFGAAAFQIARLFYDPNIGRNPDDLFDGLNFVSEELNGINKDNNGTVRPKHVRKFPRGLWDMIVENGLSRVYLGVHWRFDAFVNKPDHSLDLGSNIGGVPLGLKIARDIFETGMRKSPVLPRNCDGTEMAAAEMAKSGKKK